MSDTKNRGFASMDKEQQREIARKGGLVISQNRQHMATIGAKGGENSGKVRIKKIEESFKKHNDPNIE